MSFKTKKNILNLLSALTLVSWFLFIYLYYFHYQNVAPTKPNTELGQVYKVNNHGYIFYLTKKQEVLAYIPCFLAVIDMVVLVLLELKWRIYKQIYGR